MAIDLGTSLVRCPPMRAQYLDISGPMRGLQPAWDPLDVTGDGISHQLDGRDQQTAGQEQSGGDLMMMIMIILYYG